MKQGFRIGSLASILLPFALGASAAACGDGATGTTTTTTTTSSGTGGAGGGTGGTGGGPAAVPFQPKGCELKVAPRPEYTDWSFTKNEVGASPNIRRVRLGLGGNVAVGAAGRADPATTQGFAWQTDDGTTASEVAWGNAPDPMTWPAGNRASGVTWLTPPGLINDNGEVRMHEAYVCGLEADTTYYYRVGGGPAGKEVWSDVYSFTTTPSNPDTEITLAIAGDSRGQNNDAWRILQKKVLLTGARMQLFSGDMVDLAPDQKEWEKWLDSAWKDANGKLSTLGQILTVSAHGNHENHTSLFYGNMVLPQDVDAFPGYAELFFSFDVGPAHIVVVDDAFIAAPQLDMDYKGVLTAWLDADLGAANQNRAKVPWIITVHHHSELSSSNHGNDVDVLKVRDYFMPLWDKYHVDLNVAGHDHNYERSKPVTGPAKSPTVVPNFKDGTVYIVCAGAGADPYSAGTSSFTDVSRDYKSGGAIGFYGLLRISKTKLTIEGYELRADGTDPMFDTIDIVK
jgi:hypothetical protein